MTFGGDVFGAGRSPFISTLQFWGAAAGRRGRPFSRASTIDNKKEWRGEFGTNVSGRKMVVVEFTISS